MGKVKSMANFKWNNDLIIELIDLYRSFECLWNPKSLKYKCRNARQDAWSKLCEISGANEAEVKRKIKNLTSQFFRERKNYRKMKKSGAGAHFVSKWYAYNNMLFLADKNKLRHCSEKGLNNSEDSSNTSVSESENEMVESPSSLDINENPNTSEVDVEDETQVNIDAEIENTTPEPLSSESQPIVEESLTVLETSDKSKPGTSTQQLSTGKKGNQTLFKAPKTIKAAKRKRSEVSLEEKQEEAYQVLKDLKDRKPRTRFQVFGEHVGLKIESLRTEYAQNTVEHLISNILWEASTGKYDYYSYPYGNDIPGRQTTLPEVSPTESYSSNCSQMSNASSDSFANLTPTPIASPTDPYNAHSSVNDPNATGLLDVLSMAIQKSGI